MKSGATKRINGRVDTLIKNGFEDGDALYIAQQESKFDLLGRLAVLDNGRALQAEYTLPRTIVRWTKAGITDQITLGLLSNMLAL